MGYNVYIYVVDVINTTQVISTAALVKKEVGKIDILVNNVGIVVGKYFMDHSHDDIDKTMGINSNALMAPKK
jgi:NADP-dependent 3-hydroxy acid dehydrogenase YdfG